VVSGNVIVIRTALGNSASSFVALSNICTHQGCTVNYAQNQNSLVCPCHGATFNTNGGVTQGPASSALTRYLVAVNGNTLTVG
jgi:cytochrome b6-f complex iron-sulfur subunit